MIIKDLKIEHGPIEVRISGKVLIQREDKWYAVKAIMATDAKEDIHRLYDMFRQYIIQAGKIDKHHTVILEEQEILDGHGQIMFDEIFNWNEKT